MASTLERQLKGRGMAKPHRHAGAAETDEFQVELSNQEIERIVDAMGALESSLADAGAPAFQVSATADLLDFWNGHLMDAPTDVNDIPSQDT